MTVQAMAYVIEHSHADTLATYAVQFTLANYHDRETGLVGPVSGQRLARECRCARSTVQESIARLVELGQALRMKINPHLPRPLNTDHCAVPGCLVTGFGLEYEHADPTFKQIADACLVLMSDDERQTRFGYNKFEPARRNIEDCIPDDHPAVRLLFDSHASNRWAWLCKFHHRNVV